MLMRRRRRAALEGLVLRSLAPSDRAFVDSLSLEAFGPYARHPAKVVAEMIDDAALTVVAVCDEEAVGFAVLRLEAHRPYGPWRRPVLAHLDAVAVSRRLRKRGVGRALIARVENAAERSDALAIFLMTAAENKPARALFEAAGYDYLAGCGGAYLEREPALLLTKPLTTRARGHRTTDAG